MYPGNEGFSEINYLFSNHWAQLRIVNQAYSVCFAS